MKHTLNITLILVLLFLVSQITGLAITSRYIQVKETVTIDEATNETIILKNITYGALPYDVTRPVIEESSSFMYIMSAILIGTVLVLILIKFKKVSLWKFWFFLSIWMCLTIAFAAFLQQTIALVLALVLAIFRIQKPNVVVHNLTELFVYGGLAAIFVPLMNIFAVFMLLLLISIYDMFAVWKSKHMIKLAKFQSESRVFAGMMIPYKKPKIGKGKLVKKKKKTAILGGGDIGFPLMFAGVVMKNLMLKNTVAISFLEALIIPVLVSAALFCLLAKGKENKFYPAMPFISIGCLAGFLVVWLINLI